MRTWRNSARVLREERSKSKLRQSDMNKRLGLSNQYFSNLEMAKVGLPVRQLRNIVDILAANRPNERLEIKNALVSAMLMDERETINNFYEDRIDKNDA